MKILKLILCLCACRFNIYCVGCYKIFYKSYFWNFFNLLKFGESYLLEFYKFIFASFGQNTLFAVLCFSVSLFLSCSVWPWGNALIFKLLVHHIFWERSCIFRCCGPFDSKFNLLFLWFCIAMRTRERERKK